jgi:hypothetical protein
MEIAGQRAGQVVNRTGLIICLGAKAMKDKKIHGAPASVLINNTPTNEEK